jgi:hypothetical protein
VIRPRSDWGAAPSGGASWLAADVGVAVHWEGPYMGPYAQASVPSLLRGIQRYHQGTQGWADIAYNFVVDRFGGTWEGRGWNARSAANGTSSSNSNYLAVCYLGGQGDPFTAEAANAISALFQEHVARGGRAEITGHRDHTATACPGDEIYAWVHGTPLAPQSQEDDLTPEQAQQLAEVHAYINPARAGGGDTYLPNLLHRLMVDAIKKTRVGGTQEVIDRIDRGVGTTIDYQALAKAIVVEMLSQRAG